MHKHRAGWQMNPAFSSSRNHVHSSAFAAQSDQNAESHLESILDPDLRPFSRGRLPGRPVGAAACQLGCPLDRRGFHQDALGASRQAGCAAARQGTISYNRRQTIGRKEALNFHSQIVMSTWWPKKKKKKKNN